MKDGEQQVARKLGVQPHAAFDEGAQSDVPLDHDQRAGFVLGKASHRDQIGGKMASNGSLESGASSRPPLSMKVRSPMSRSTTISAPVLSSARRRTAIRYLSRNPGGGKPGRNNALAPRPPGG